MEYYLALIQAASGPGLQRILERYPVRDANQGDPAPFYLVVRARERVHEVVEVLHNVYLVEDYGHLFAVRDYLEELLIQEREPESGFLQLRDVLFSTFWSI